MTNKNGLTNEEVIKSRKIYGSNELIKIKKKTIFKIFLESLGDPIIKILLIALAIKLLFIISLSDVFETIGIAVAVFLASFISTISEYGNEEIFKKLQEENDLINVKVFRNKKLEIIKINDVVVNDIIMLESGDITPADAQIIDGDIYINESMLTGESKEIYKNKNDIVYRGTLITKGRAIIKVLKVGINTEYGKISLEIQKKDPTSPLKNKLYELAKIISKIGYVGAFIISITYLVNEIIIKNNFNYDLIIATLTTPKVIINHLIYALTIAVTIIIVAVPEGLPMMITLVLSKNMKKMLKDNILVRKPIGIETSGSINYLLTDKTGTLTKGVLEVIYFITGDLKRFSNYNELKKLSYYDLLYESIIINNECSYNDNKLIGGNETDKALRRFLPNKEYSKKIINRVLFNSDNKYSKIIFDNYFLIKGAFEKIIIKCNKYLDINGNEKPLLNKNNYYNDIKKYTNKNMRIIALAKGYKDENNLILIGYLVLKDDIRKEAKDVINEIKNANINVIMITGDSKETAINIAKECNIIENNNDIILNSDELNNLDDNEIIKNISNIKVISRAHPSDKSRLVSILQNNNLIVGMTGDGVNDAPALKKANVGFAMGSGSDVAKEASDIVILDNNISSISKAILYGRTIYKSIRKFVTYQLTINMTALFLSIIGSFIGVSTPITIIQMLWLNMIMDTFAGLAFAYEPALKYYMKEKTKNLNDSIINKFMLFQIIIMSLYSFTICVLFLKLPIIKTIIRNDNKHFMTAYFALFIFMGICNQFNFRSEKLNIFKNILKNKMFLFINIFIIIVQIIIIYYGNDLFRTYGLTFKELLIVILISLTTFIVNIIEKRILKKKGINLSY